MGYDIHITRKEYWHEEDKTKNISLQEWQAYVAADSELRMDNSAEVKTTNAEIIRIESPGLSAWMKYSKSGVNENYAWFALSNGNIVVKNPDDEIRNKMIEIAEVLQAKVQGDDGEIYNDKTL